jgi:hypothetical protein
MIKGSKQKEKRRLRNRKTKEAEENEALERWREKKEGR